MALRAGPIQIASSAKICRAEDLARLRRALLIEQRFGFGLAGGPPEPVTERNTTI